MSDGFSGGGEHTALRDRVFSALATVIDPELRLPLVDLDMIAAVTVEGDPLVDAGVLIRVGVRLTVVGCPAAREIERSVIDVVRAVPGVAECVVELSVMSAEQRTALVDRLRGGRARVNAFQPGGLTRVIAVTSGKGGVGKSTVTANLAVILSQRGLRVGIVDADIFGFSIPALLGLATARGGTVRPTRVGDLMLPPVAFGVKVISIGMFLPEDDSVGAVSWRGPMLHRTLEQFLSEVFFGDLDVLLLDLPPGTGDVAISLGQLLPNAEVLVVTTPQPSAADVAVRSGVVARQTGQKVIGVVETMSAMSLADGATFAPFGSGGGAAVAQALSAAEFGDVPLLGQIPLSVALREGGDAGKPVVLADPSDSAALALEEVADSLLRLGSSLVGRNLPMSPR